MTNRIKTIFSNMSWLMVSQIITSICAFVWTILITRYLGPSEYGIYGSAQSFSGLLVIIADLGVSSYVIRVISTDFTKEEYYLRNCFTLTIFLSILYLVLVLFLLKICGWDSYMTFICILFVFENIIIRFSSIAYISFQAHEELKYQSIAKIITTIFSFLLILLVLLGDSGLTGVALAFLIANFISFIYIMIKLIKHFVKPKLVFNYSFYKKLIIGGIPFAFGSIFYLIYYSIDILMITQFIGTYETGLYNAAYKLISVLTLFYSIYTTAIYPVMVKLFEDDANLLNMSLIKSMKYLLAITVPIAVFTCLYSYDIINIYGPEYIKAGGVLNILVWTVCFLFVNGICSSVLYVSFKEYTVTKIFGIAAVFNVVLNLFLIPHYSLYGAAVATVLSEILIFVLEMNSIRKINQLPDRHFVFDVFKICFVSGILGIILYYLNLNLWFAIPVSIGVYLLLLILIRIFDDDDKFIIKQIINK